MQITQLVLLNIRQSVTDWNVLDSFPVHSRYKYKTQLQYKPDQKEQSKIKRIAISFVLSVIQNRVVSWNNVATVKNKAYL